MPEAAKSAQTQLWLKAPMRIRNSPMKPLRVGRPMDDMVMIKKKVA